LCFYDLETGSRNPKTTQPIQLAAVIIDARKLEIVDKFESLICPMSDEQAIAAGLDTIQDEALNVNKKTREELALAPQLNVVWQQFQDFVARYSKGADKWKKPIAAGFNIKNFDTHIIERLCREMGPYDKERQSQSIFHPVHSQDLMDDVFRWFENDVDVKSMSMDAMRDLFGLSKENSHDALQDVLDGAGLLIRFMKLYRNYYPRIRFRPGVVNPGVVDGKRIEKEVESV
jgi:DNA polymerase III epsilon subunit-like protein